MKIEQLQRRNKAINQSLVEDYWALYAGGEQLGRRIDSFIPRNPAEPADVWARRKRDWHHINYSQSILTLFSGMVFEDGLKISASDGDDIEWATKWAADVGNGASLQDVVEEQFTKALVKGRAIWVVEPMRLTDAPPADLAAWHAQGLDGFRLVTYEAEEVVDWQHDESGALRWILVYRCSRERASVADEPRVRHEWREYTGAGVTVYSHTLNEEERLDPTTEISGETFRFPLDLGAPPVVVMAPPPHLWFMNLVYSVQRELFALSNAKNFQMRRTCYVVPLFKVIDKDNNPPAMDGEGRFIYCHPDETLEWPTPPTEVLTYIQSDVKTLKDELFRITHQMASGVENNAASVGRSGLSKRADQDPTNTMLRRYGKMVRDAVEQTLNIAAAIRNVPRIDWAVSGLDVNADLSAEDLMGILGQEALFGGLGSVTWSREIRKRVSDTTLPNVRPNLRTQIYSEIDGAEFPSAVELGKLNANPPPNG